MIWFFRSLGLVSVFGLVASFVLPYAPIVSSAEQPETTQISVPARSLEVVCPGSLYQLGGEDGTEVDSLQALGDADFFLIENSLATPFRGSEPAIFTASSEGQSSKDLSGYQWQQISESRIAGLISVTCKKPVTEAWMLGGRTNLGSESLLILHNPDVLSTILDLSFYTEDELINDSTSLAPGETKVINLSRYVSTEEAVGINLKSQGGRFAGWVQSKSNAGITPTGVDLEAHNQLQQNPTMLITVQSADLPLEFRIPKLHALTTEPLSTTVSVSSLEGGFGDAFRVELDAGVNSIELPLLEPGSYRLTLEAEAALLSSRTTDPLLPDFSITQSESAISGDVEMVSVIEGTVEIASTSDSIATLKITRGGNTETALIGEVSSQKMLSAEVMRGDKIEISGDDLLIRVRNQATEYLPADNSNIGSDLEITVR